MQYVECINEEMIPIYNKTLEGDIEVAIKWNGELLPGLSERIMRNGSVMGFVAEGIAAHIYRASHTHTPTKGYDLATNNPKYSLNIESKTVTKTGGKFAPSEMYGKGRFYNHDVFQEVTPTKDFFIADTHHAAETGKLRFILMKGTDVVKMNHCLSRKKSTELFERNR